MWPTAQCTSSMAHLLLAIVHGLFLMAWAVVQSSKFTVFICEYHYITIKQFVQNRKIYINIH